MSGIIEFTPAGLVAHDETNEAQVSDAPNAGMLALEAAKGKPKPSSDEEPTAPHPRPKPGEPTPPIIPPSPTPKRHLQKREWVKEMRARLKVVEKEIRALVALEQERDEILRMIKAAKAPPANVRTIDSARRIG